MGFSLRDIYIKRVVVPSGTLALADHGILNMAITTTNRALGACILRPVLVLLLDTIDTGPTPLFGPEADTSKDPYNAKYGFFWSHMKWKIIKQGRLATVDVSDLSGDW
ncbi:UNVERIFIED_CONTAM: hypothetical protein HDU68_007461 [Siphonaria sp. JEL0065]|nr:hypothetical protein HDU68_007461 [Siphonaria sp. JEL0065]